LKEHSYQNVDKKEKSKNREKSAISNVEGEGYFRESA